MTHLYVLPVKYDLVPQFAVEISPETLGDSPVFKVPGHAASITDAGENVTKDDRVFSKYFLQASALNGKLNRFTLNYSPFDIELIKRGMLEPNGANTVEEPLQFIERTRIDAQLQYRKRKFCLCTQQTGQINRGGFSMSHTYESSDVTDWSTSHGLTGTPDFVTKDEVNANEAWSHMTGGPNPCEVNSVVTPIQDIRWELNWTIAKIDPNGTLTYIDAEIGMGAGTIVLTSWLKNNDWKNLHDGYTEFEVRYKLTDGLGGGQNHEVVWPRVKAKRYDPAAQAASGAYVPHTLNCEILGAPTIVTT